MTNSTDVSDMKMTRFGYRVDLIRERHVRVKDEAKIASRGTDWDDIIVYIYINCRLCIYKHNIVIICIVELELHVRM